MEGFSSEGVGPGKGTGVGPGKGTGDINKTGDHLYMLCN
jgi:hypothetical protein